MIALIDTGLTPYYDLFHVQDDRFVRDAIPVNVTAVRFALPDGPDPIGRDEETWSALRPGELYHFSGTRLLGISFQHETNYHFVRDANGHGAGVSFIAAREAPAAIIVMVQMSPGLCLLAGDPSCTFSPTIADAMEWIAEQEWIDIVSVSLAGPGNLPDRAEAHPEVGRYLRASEKAARSGKIIVNGAGNDPVPMFGDHFNGPPWVIAVGGADEATRGEQAISSKTVDVVANFTEYAPEWGEGEMEWRHGTSFSTPVVAGTLANAMDLVRRGAPDRTISAGEWRDALNASAFYFAAADWRPGPPGREPLPDDLVYSLTLPILLQPQMGWGYVNASLAPEIARRVLEGDLAPPPEKSQAAAFQPAWQRAREEFWAAYSR